HYKLNVYVFCAIHNAHQMAHNVLVIPPPSLFDSSYTLTKVSPSTMWLKEGISEIKFFQPHRFFTPFEWMILQKLCCTVWPSIPYSDINSTQLLSQSQINEKLEIMCGVCSLLNFIQCCTCICKTT